jgi:hypothetical protein
MLKVRHPARTFALAAVLSMAAAAPAAAAHRPSSGGSTASGYDISYPQCNATLPSGQKFAVVGVNGGLANDANPCLSTELTWAQTSPGLTSPNQPGVSLYINTADPGPSVADWPSTGSSNPYGTCAGGWSQACAYTYGQARAQYSYGLVSQISSSLASGAPWWLDIETGNSWATSSTSGYTALNVATIQGFVAGLQGMGATGPVGIYSTASQWQAITGLNATSSQTDFASQPDWVAGARTLRGAESNCSASFTGGHVALTQYPANGFDGDYACP